MHTTDKACLGLGEGGALPEQVQPAKGDLQADPRLRVLEVALQQPLHPFQPVVERAALNVQGARRLRFSAAAVEVGAKRRKKRRGALRVVLEQRLQLGFDETRELGAFRQVQQQVMNAEVPEVVHARAARCANPEARGLRRLFERAA